MAAAGDLIGPYRLLSQLGAGAMGEVWRARDERLDRYVAIKVLPAQHATDPARRARVLREARAAAAVPHPNVVTLFDIVSEGDSDVLVMELVEGTTLSERVKSAGPVEPRQAIDWLIDISDALASAHARGILHRDIKTANVMVDDRGQAKILDFGLAKLRDAAPAPSTPRPRTTAARRAIALDETMPSEDEAEGLPRTPADVALGDTMASTGELDGTLSGSETRAGALLGTPMYMAPEQILGAAPDERSEVFSVGVIAYELLAGKSPYRARTLDELFAQIEHEPPPPLPASVPAPLAAIVGRALAKQPDDRHDMPALRDALVELRQRLYAPRARRWPWLAAAAVASIAAVAAFALRPAAPTPESPADKYVRQAVEQYNVFDNKKAVALLRSARKHDPDHPLTYAYTLLFGYADAEDTRQALRDAVRLAPALKPGTHERALLDAAVALAQDGPTAARAALTRARTPADPARAAEIAFWRAELAFRAGDFQAADREFEALLAGEPSGFRGRIYDHHASTLLYFDKTERALEIGRLYAEAFPGEADAIGVHATTLAAAGQLDQALARAREALDLYDSEDTLAGLAKVHAYRGELTRARELYEQSLARAPEPRKPLRRAALAVLHLLDADLEAARQVTAPCLTKEIAALPRSGGACLWAASLVYPERIDDIIALTQHSTDRPDHRQALEALLEAQRHFPGLGCFAPPAATRDRLAAGLPDNTDAIDATLADVRLYYAEYHVPFFRSFPACQRAQLAAARGEHQRAAAGLAELGRPPYSRIPAIGRHELTCEAAACSAPPDWTTLDPDSAVRRRFTAP